MTQLEDRACPNWRFHVLQLRPSTAKEIFLKFLDR